MSKAFNFDLRTKQHLIDYKTNAKNFEALKKLKSPPLQNKKKSEALDKGESNFALTPGKYANMNFTNSNYTCQREKLSTLGRLRIKGWFETNHVFFKALNSRNNLKNILVKKSVTKWEEFDSNKVHQDESLSEEKVLSDLKSKNYSTFCRANNPQVTAKLKEKLANEMANKIILMNNKNSSNEMNVKNKNQVDMNYYSSEYFTGQNSVNFLLMAKNLRSNYLKAHENLNKQGKSPLKQAEKTDLIFFLNKISSFLDPLFQTLF
jgi:hypothetical protein